MKNILPSTLLFISYVSSILSLHQESNTLEANTIQELANEIAQMIKIESVPIFIQDSKNVVENKKEQGSFGILVNPQLFLTLPIGLQTLYLGTCLLIHHYKKDRSQELLNFWISPFTFLTLTGSSWLLFRNRSISSLLDTQCGTLIVCALSSAVDSIPHVYQKHTQRIITQQMLNYIQCPFCLQEIYDNQNLCNLKKKHLLQALSQKGPTCQRHINLQTETVSV